MADTPIIPLTVTLGGAYLAWFGVHYWRTDVKWPTDPIKAVLTGKKIPDAVKADPSALVQGSVVQTPEGTGTVGIGVGLNLADAAKKYIGAGYVWGGKADKPGNWDCSSFVSYLIAHDLGGTLPGGGHWNDSGYPGREHGPGSTQYMMYGVGINLKDVQPGDLVVSTEHIGVAIGNGQMISAEDPSRGTQIGTFPEGFPAGPPVYRRLTTAEIPTLGSPGLA